MTCPFCKAENKNIIKQSYTICENCGCEHNSYGEIFKEGNYEIYVNKLLQKVINESSSSGLSHMVRLLQNQVSKNPNELDLVLGRLGEIVEHLDNAITLGKDRTSDMICVIECIENLHNFGKTMYKQGLMEQDTYDFIYSEENDDISTEYPYDIGQDPVGLMDDPSNSYIGIDDNVDDDINNTDVIDSSMPIEDNDEDIDDVSIFQEEEHDEELGDEEEIEEIKESLEVGKQGKYEIVKRPKLKEVLTAKGETPDVKVASYRKAVLTDPENPLSAYEEVDGSIPFTQEPAEENEKELDDEGVKKKVSESFNGYKLKDKIKIAGSARTFEIVEITIDNKFIVESDNITMNIDPMNDDICLAEDREVIWQRTNEVINETRDIWEQIQHNYNHKVKTIHDVDMLTESCVNGVCSLTPSNTSSSHSSKKISETPLVSYQTSTDGLPHIKVGKMNEIYKFIKENNLHTIPKEKAMSELLKEFSNVVEDLETALSDASNTVKVEEMDKNYNYVNEVVNEFSLNEAYEELKKNGIV